MQIVWNGLKMVMICNGTRFFHFRWNFSFGVYCCRSAYTFGVFSWRRILIKVIYLFIFRFLQYKNWTQILNLINFTNWLIFYVTRELVILIGLWFVLFLNFFFKFINLGIIKIHNFSNILTTSWQTHCELSLIEEFIDLYCKKLRTIGHKNLRKLKFSNHL